MAKKTIYKNKKKRNNFKKAGSGIGKDERKEKLFFFPEDTLDSKTELEGLRKTVFMDRYSLKDEKGDSMEVYPEQMWRRVAKGIAQFEKGKKNQDLWEEKFYDVMKGFKFVPGGRIISGAGTGYEVTFFNCYVIPSPKDSRGGIMENITQTVEIQSRAGGVGLNLSSLRPRGARVKKVNGTSSGPVNWASLYSTANHDVIQQGGSRRGALMLMLNDWHPDIIEFIKVKEDLTKIPGANLSLCVSDSFMDAVKKDGDWDLVFPDLDDPDYDEKWDGDIEEWKALGKKVITYETVKAREVWEMIAQAAWRSAEPGLHFLERSNKRSNTWYFEKLVATNPCGEQPLGPWAVCNLGSMNLSSYVDENGGFDYDSLGKDVHTAILFMDNVVDVNFYFYIENWNAKMAIMMTGLVTMVLGDTLIKMGIRYGSEESLEVIDKIYRTIRDNAYDESCDLAKEKGAFPKFDKEKYLEGHFIKRLPKRIKEKIARNGIRNAVVLTQAPTGTTSLLSWVSSGIEPNYDFEFTRTDRTGEHTIYHPLYKEFKEANPGKSMPSYFVNSADLSPEEHVRVQAKVQEYTDSSISKTVNAPEEYTVEDVEKLYRMAYELGCKGITFFRDGSRKGVLERASDKKEKANGVKPAQNGEPLRQRPLAVRGATYRLMTPMGSAFVTINESEDGDPLEVFVNVGKAGSDVTAMAEALGRSISVALRFRGDLSPKERAKHIAEQLSGIGGRRAVGFGPNKILSLPDAVAGAINTHFGFKTNGNGVGHETEEKHANGKTNGKLTNGNGHANGVEAKMDLAGAVMVAAPGLAGNSNLVGVDDPTMASAESLSASASPSANADICPSCGAGALVYEEGCSKCHACGHSEC